MAEAEGTVITEEIDESEALRLKVDIPGWNANGLPVQLLPEIIDGAEGEAAAKQKFAAAMAVIERSITMISASLQFKQGLANRLNLSCWFNSSLFGSLHTYDGYLPLYE